MTGEVVALVQDFLAWLGEAGRPYPDVMEAWRTSCPRLPVWEEATELGLVARVNQNGQARVIVTGKGRAFQHGATPQQEGRQMPLSS